MTTTDPSTRIMRHARNVALIYLLIRGVPDLLLYVLIALPAETVQAFADGAGQWVRFIISVTPLGIPSVPPGFKSVMVLLPTLLAETLLVFLFCAAFLRRRPWAAREDAGRVGWIALIVAILAWSVLIRGYLLRLLVVAQFERIYPPQPSPDGWQRPLPLDFMQANWAFMAVAYLSAAAWAWLPVWLHFRFARRPADAMPAADVGRLFLPMRRGSAFSAFMIAALATHVIFLTVFYLGLWPWAVASLRIPLRREDVAGMELPMILNQVVLAMMGCALAAWLHARRLGLDGASGIWRSVIRPGLAGVAAYLLTNLIILAAIWLLAWADHGIIRSLARDVEHEPSYGMVLMAVFNILTLLLLCAVAARLAGRHAADPAAPAKRRLPALAWGGLSAALALFTGTLACVGWTLIGANQGIAGGRPGAGVTGTLGHASWRNMEQWCTGVIETRHGTWLMGRTDGRVPGSGDHAGAIDLGKLANPDGQGRQRGSLFGGSRDFTTLSRLQDDGAFKVMVTAPDVVCMAEEPESGALFLFTGLDRRPPVETPEAPEAPADASVSPSAIGPGLVPPNRAPLAPPTPSAPRRTDFRQDAIFRSTDHGASWEMIENGFMTAAGELGWNLRPTFSSERSVWAWGAEPHDGSAYPSPWAPGGGPASLLDDDGTERFATALFHSADQGATTARVYSPEPLVAPAGYIQAQIGADGGSAGIHTRGEMDRERFVVQIDDTRAYAWVSEAMWYEKPGQRQQRLTITSRAVLTRPDADSGWRVADVSRRSGLRITHLVTSADGRTYATLIDGEQEWLAKLDKDTGEWIERRETPSVLPRWLAGDGMETRYFQSNGDYQVVSLWGDVILPRWIFPFVKEPAEISVDAHYYTRDGGRTWHQLAIPGYLGVMGLSPRGSRLYWSQGNWYSNDEPVQRHYDLAE